MGTWHKKGTPHKTGKCPLKPLCKHTLTIVLLWEREHFATSCLLRTDSLLPQGYPHKHPTEIFFTPITKTKTVGKERSGSIMPQRNIFQVVGKESKVYLFIYFHDLIGFGIHRAFLTGRVFLPSLSPHFAPCYQRKTEQSIMQVCLRF